ncbi:MAG: hypothetical protein PHV93_01160 [Candidatus Pacebacteria bacterium]|nr:hypothetical protein [Candidatus Paceibacterota bacterium]
MEQKEKNLFGASLKCKSIEFYLCLTLLVFASFSIVIEKVEASFSDDPNFKVELITNPTATTATVPPDYNVTLTARVTTPPAGISKFIYTMICDYYNPDAGIEESWIRAAGEYGAPIVYTPDTTYTMSKPCVYSHPKSYVDPATGKAVYFPYTPFIRVEGRNEQGWGARAIDYKTIDVFPPSPDAIGNKTATLVFTNKVLPSKEGFPSVKQASDFSVFVDTTEYPLGDSVSIPVTPGYHLVSLVGDPYYDQTSSPGCNTESVYAGDNDVATCAFTQTFKGGWLTVTIDGASINGSYDAFTPVLAGGSNIQKSLKIGEATYLPMGVYKVKENLINAHNPKFSGDCKKLGGGALSKIAQVVVNNGTHSYCHITNSGQSAFLSGQSFVANILGGFGSLFNTIQSMWK